MAPHGPSAQGATARHALSPGSAIDPGAHGASGKTATQPPASSGAKPSAQASGGTPTGAQVPSGARTSSAPQPGGSSGGSCPSSAGSSPPQLAGSSRKD